MRLDPAPDANARQAGTIGIAATTVKGYEIFEEQFYALVDALRGADPRAAPGGHPQGRRSRPRKRSTIEHRSGPHPHCIFSAYINEHARALHLYFLLTPRELGEVVSGTSFAFIGLHHGNSSNSSTRWQTMPYIWPLTNLYGSLSLFRGMSVLIFIVVRALSTTCGSSAASCRASAQFPSRTR